MFIIFCKWRWCAFVFDVFDVFVFVVELKNSIFVRTCSLLVDNFTRLLYMIFIGTNVYSYVVRLVLCYVSPSPHRPFPRSLACTHDLCTFILLPFLFSIAIILLYFYLKGFQNNRNFFLIFVLNLSMSVFLLATHFIIDLLEILCFLPNFLW